MPKIYCDRISGHQDNRLYHVVNVLGETRNIAVEFDNKQTWYATVYATFSDFIERGTCVEYQIFGFRSAAEEWACCELCGDEPYELCGERVSDV